MSKTPYQFRYYGEKDPNNFPQDLTERKLISGNIFTEYNKHFITQLGIQGTPGVQFKLNNGKEWITIGKTGIYELDLTDKGRIESIQFNKNGYFNSINPETNKSFLFIDILYKGEEVDQVITDKEFNDQYGDFDLIISGGDSVEETN